MARAVTNGCKDHVVHDSDSARRQGAATAGRVGTLEAAVEMDGGFAMMRGSEDLGEFRAF